MTREDDDRQTRVEYRGTGFYVGLVAIIVFGLALFILAVQNTENVQISFLGFTFTVPLFGVAIGGAIIAVVIDELIGLVWRKRRRTRLEERAELAQHRSRAGEAREEEQGAREIDRRSGTPEGSIGAHRLEDEEENEQS